MLNVIEKAIEDLMVLLPIPGPPGKERQVTQNLHSMFVEMGIPDNQIVYDSAQEQSEYGGDVGNMIVRIEGRSTWQGCSVSRVERLLRHKRFRSVLGKDL